MRLCFVICVPFFLCDFVLSFVSVLSLGFWDSVLSFPILFWGLVISF